MLYFCETITKSVDVGLRVASEFYFTSPFIIDVTNDKVYITI
jgi:hypothetical protein